MMNKTLLHTRHLYGRVLRFALCIILMMIFTGNAWAEYNDVDVVTQRYTQDQPLKISTSIDFQPFSFRDDKGMPTGYCIDVINEILNNLNIPHIFVMNEPNRALEDFKNSETDLIVTPNIIHNINLYYSKCSIIGFTPYLAYKKGTVAPDNVKDITDKVLLRDGDYCYDEALSDGLNKKNIVLLTPQSAMACLSMGKYNYAIFEKKNLKYLIKKYGVDDIEIKDINLHSGNVKFVSSDSILINVLDDQFARINQSGKIDKIKDKWLNNNDEQTSSWILIATSTILLAIVIIFIIMSSISKKHINRTLHKMIDINSVMEKALDTGDNYMICYKIKNKRLRNLYGNFLSAKGCTYDDFISHVASEDVHIIESLTKNIPEDNKDEYSGTFRWKDDYQENNIAKDDSSNDSEDGWRYINILASREYNKDGGIKNIICSLSDITDVIKNESKEKALKEKYNIIFNSSMLGFAIYSNKGYLVEYNDKMKEICKIDANNIAYFYKTNIFNIDTLKGVLNPEHIEPVSLCTIKRLGDIDTYNNLELDIHPVYDDNNLQFILMSIRDVSTERNLFLQSRINDDEIEKINARIHTFENELHYLLKQSNMMAWRSSIKEHSLVLFRDLRALNTKMDFNMISSFTCNEVDYEKILEIINPDVNMTGNKKISIQMKNIFTNDDTLRWYEINSMPNYNENGTLEGCFGLIRDVSELKESQEKLNEETERANQSGHLKSVFLANMSHEIRTPLNAIVGFCDLLESASSNEDRQQFVHIIRNNCDMLLHIVNDILMLSTMDSNGLVIKAHEDDFSKTFNELCVTMEQRVNEKNISLIKDNPYTFCTTLIDHERIMQVITNFVTNAIKYTMKGHVKVGYREEYRDGKDGLYIYCEDTGTGIPEEQCPKIFGRFVKLNSFIQGTGLGLSICKAIAEKCNGDIGVTSKLGEGSTFWIWIPCDIVHD